MASNIFGRLAPSSRGTRSFYAQLRARDDDHDDDSPDVEQLQRQHQPFQVDEENLRQHLDDFDTADLPVEDSRLTVESTHLPTTDHESHTGNNRSTRHPRYLRAHGRTNDEDFDNDVPASLLVEHNEGGEPASPTGARGVSGSNKLTHPSPAHEYVVRRNEPRKKNKDIRHRDNGAMVRGQPRSLMAGNGPVGAREKALWRWVNTTNLDSFMRDVYDYYEGGGLWCILFSNALWLL